LKAKAKSSSTLSTSSYFIKTKVSSKAHIVTSLCLMDEFHSEAFFSVVFVTVEYKGKGESSIFLNFYLLKGAKCRKDHFTKHFLLFSEKKSLFSAKLDAFVSVLIKQSLCLESNLAKE
jgi:hypothetical protein